MTRRPSRHRRARMMAAVTTAVLAAGCWRIGEPTQSEALVTWAGYPDTVRVASTFSFEFGGPISTTACGRLDTARLIITDSSIVLSAARSTFQAVCANQRISFYEARPIQLPSAGTYPIVTSSGTPLGAIVATDSGQFSPVRTVGEGTIRDVAGCLLFGPGWIGNQRVFALSRVPPDVREAEGGDRIVHVRGQLRGFTSCGSWGSRPRISVDTAWVTGRRVGDLY